MVDLTVNLIINIKGQHKGIKTVPDPLTQTLTKISLYVVYLQHIEQSITYET